MKVKTPLFRASYLTVFTPRAFEDGAEEKYSVQMLFDKKKTDLSEFKKKLQAVAVKAWGKDKAKWPKNFRWPFKDGDEMPDDMAESQKEIYAGMIYCSADSKRPPGVYDQRLEEITNPREFYSGCYAYASLFMVPYENVGGRDGRSGIKLYLQGIQLAKKGENLGGANAKSDFEELPDESADMDEGQDDDTGGDDDDFGL